MQKKIVSKMGCQMYIVNTGRGRVIGIDKVNGLYAKKSFCIEFPEEVSTKESSN